MVQKNAYCIQCERYAPVMWDTEMDDSGDEHAEATCEYCGSRIDRCHNCKRWTSDNVDRLIGACMGTCKRRKGKSYRVSATHLICKGFSRLYEPLTATTDAGRQNAPKLTSEEWSLVRFLVESFLTEKGVYDEHDLKRIKRNRKQYETALKIEEKLRRR